jgi:hypothetical protein
MNEFNEVVRASFDERLQIITEAGGVPRKRARSVVSAIRRRRAVRAGATTGASVLTVGAVVLGMVNLFPTDDVAPGAFLTPAPGAPAWCALST